MFDAKKFKEKAVKEIRDKVGNEKVLIATSGGVDSMTCATLAFEAIGNRAKVAFIDDGLMREGEGKEVINFFRSRGHEAEIAERSEDFFLALKGVLDPEEKRKRFRDVFYKTLGKLIKEKGTKWMIQGTIKADILETSGGIKTQHNVLEQIGVSPDLYGLKILEPLQDLFKPQVRMLAKELGIPEKICKRMPFPGPGLATRIVGEVTQEKAETVRKATRIVEEEVERVGTPVFQAFAVLLNDRATGIKEEKRLFGNIIVVRIVESEDALTASVPGIGWNSLERIRDRILDSIPGVCRVLYDLTPKPPATIEYV